MRNCQPGAYYAGAGRRVAEANLRHISVSDHPTTDIRETCTLGLPKISQFWKIVAGGVFSHYLDHSEFSGGKINEIEKCLGVANRN